MSRLRSILVFLASAGVACESHGLKSGRIDAGQDVQPWMAPDLVSESDGRGADVPVRDATVERFVEPVPAVCGNGVVESGEDCDDGNTKSSDGCSATCRNECRWLGENGVFQVCGDGIFDYGERCDDGNTASGDGCSGDCAHTEPGYQCTSPGKPCTPLCGDGIVIAPETCDDGNDVDGDGCTRFCLLQPGWECSGTWCTPRRPAVDGGATTGLPTGPAEYCGDGVVSGAEACDLGAQNGVAYPDRAGCGLGCSWMPYCGDGIVDSIHGEECDGGPKCNSATSNWPCGTDCRYIILP